MSDIIANQSIGWIKQRDPSKPFVLLCWQKAPHRIWEPELATSTLITTASIPSRQTFTTITPGAAGIAEHDQDMMISTTMRLNEDCKLTDPEESLPRAGKIWDAYYGPRNEAFLKQKLTGQQLTAWKYNRFMHDYLGCVKGLDDNVGRLLKYLDDSGLARNTIVVYSSDQGLFLGEHGWFDKRWIFEESARGAVVDPLAVGVTKPGATCENIVSGIDLGETFLEAAGVPIPDRMQGQSLIPLLKGNEEPGWRTAFLLPTTTVSGPGIACGLTTA